jgi:predicted transcriptional regulator
MKDATREAILREVVGMVRAHSDLEPDEFTTEDFAAEMNVTELEAYRMLRREIARGTLEKRSVTIGGHVRCAFRKVDANADSGIMQKDLG